MPFDENGNSHIPQVSTTTTSNGAGDSISFKGLHNIQSAFSALGFESTGILRINYDAQNSGTKVLRIADTRQQHDYIHWNIHCSNQQH
jgi:hypothetical protein